MKQFLQRVFGRALPGRVRGVHSRDAMQLRLEIERARAVRANRNLSLLILGYERPLDPTGKMIEQLADRVLQRVRMTDELGWLDGGQLGVILPDTTHDGAQKLADDVCQLCQGDLPTPDCLIYLHPADETQAAVEDSGAGNGRAVRQAQVLPLPDGLDFNRPDGHAHGHENGNGRHHSSDGARADEAGGDDSTSGEGNVALAVRREVTLAMKPPQRNNGSTSGLAGRAVRTARLDDFFAQGLPLWKRSLDVFLAGLLLVVLSPLMFVVAVAIRLTSRGRVLFVQRRTGLAGRPFHCFKFRTMYEGAHDEQSDLRSLSTQDGPAFKLPDDPRTTVIGKSLRATSIDELPQLWNVLRGEMSFVGPRPLPVAEAADCKPWQQRRHDVTPGLTCIWQVWGRSRVSFDQWIRMDLNYVDHVSPAHDLKLIVATVPAVLARRGAS